MTDITIGPIVLNPATHYSCVECGTRFTTDGETVLNYKDMLWHLECVEVLLLCSLEDADDDTGVRH